MSDTPIRTMSSIAEDAIQDMHEVIRRTPNVLQMIESQIKKFKDSLKGNEETGIVLVPFGSNNIILVTEIVFINPGFIVIKGIEESSKKAVNLLQHVSQTNILLKSVPVQDGAQPRKIGFQVLDAATPTREK